MTLSLVDECERLNERRLLDEEKIISPAATCLFRLGKTTYDLVLTLVTVWKFGFCLLKNKQIKNYV